MGRTHNTEFNIHPSWRVQEGKLLLQDLHGAFNEEPYKIDFTGTSSQIEITYKKKIWTFTDEPVHGHFKSVTDSTYLILGSASCRTTESDNWWLMSAEEKNEIIGFLNEFVESIEAYCTSAV